MRKSKREMRILAGVFFFTFAVGLLVFLIAERIEYDAQQRQVQAVTQMYGEQLGHAAQYQARKLQMVTAMLRIEPKEFGWFSRAAEELRDKPDVLSPAALAEWPSYCGTVGGRSCGCGTVAAGIFCCQGSCPAYG